MQPEKPSLRAVIFDMDGVLTDSEPFYYEAINTVLAQHGVRLQDEETRHILGTTIDTTWRWLVQRFNLSGEIGAWRQRYDHEVVRILQEKVEPARGLYPLLMQVERRGLQRALASASQRNWVEVVLRKLRLDRYFPVVVAGDDVSTGKPDPAIYLMAAGRLGAEPGRCLVIEDSPVGVEAARRAGMRVVAVRTESTRGLDLSQAHQVIESLEAFDFALLD